MSKSDYTDNENELSYFKIFNGMERYKILVAYDGTEWNGIRANGTEWNGTQNVVPFCSHF